MAENIENNGCSQRDNAEHEGYVKASRSFNRISLPLFSLPLLYEKEGMVANAVQNQTGIMPKAR